MKRYILAAVVMTLTGACTTIEEAPQVSASEKKALTAEGRDIIMEFGKTLVGYLKDGVKAGGPVKAIEVCNIMAPAVAADLATKYGVELGRTSLKPRNPDNGPDAWEKSVLIKFEARKAAGEDLKKMLYTEIVMEDDRPYFRMMKAIPTAQEPCLLCHGDRLESDIVSRLNSLYPDDRARGYQAGDIRGAFTLKQAL